MLKMFQSVRLQKGTVQWDRFVETPVGVDFKVWLFNVTNPDDIINGEKPIIKEIGPYHYIETRKKNILSTDDKEDTVSYEQYLTMEFNQSLSGDLTEDDELTLLNPVMLKVRSADGVYTVNRGQNDVLELGHIIRWNEKQTLPNWGRVESINNATCNQVRGTDSTIYAPHITRDRSLEIFSTDICR
ncbi:hypothetical protein NQ318_021988 [Aromia moschata]|uniref:Sensory neuron membrane protein 2 n=1 Tax=Aromia moschata TaxID=1265417 RepID=A0AAV8Z5E9_9CUCU|nr:hypothetical protein NQ318_021988 [Aromia moschata]